MREKTNLGDNWSVILYQVHPKRPKDDVVPRFRCPVASFV